MKYINICNAIPVWLRVYNIYSVPVWYLACKLDFHNVVVQHLEAGEVEKVMYVYDARDGNTKILT